MFIIKRIFTAIFVSTFFICVIGLAGTFTPTPSSPGASTYNLSDIYNKLTSYSYSYSGHSFSPVTTPASTYNTLTQIWNAIPARKTLASGDLDSRILSFGYYLNTSLVSIEPNLIASNIASGTTIFGVVGTYVHLFDYGVSCSQNSQCQSGICGYEYSSGPEWLKYCSHPFASGVGPCDENIQCQDNYCTSSNTCSNRQIGSPCGNNNDCLVGICSDYTCAYYTNPSGWSYIISGERDWVGASAACSALGPAWHLPTKVQLVDALTDQLINSGSNPGGFPESQGFWSGTEVDANNAWGASGYNGGPISSYPASKIGYMAVRCTTW